MPSSSRSFPAPSPPASASFLEARLARQFGVSQATVNGALQDLHEQGLVAKHLNRSTHVRRYTVAEVENLFAVRMVLEPAAAAALALSWSAEAGAILGEQVERLRSAARTGALPEFCIADYTFHQEIYRLGGNSFLAQACQAIAAAPFAYILCDCVQALPTDYAALAEDHRQVVDAIAAGPEAAARVTQAHIRKWLDHSVRALRPA